MRKRRRLPWKWLLGIALVLFLGFYFGGGLWGWGPGSRIEEVAGLPEESPSDLVKKRDAYRRIEQAGSEEGRKAATEAERLGEILELWAEDRYLGAEARVRQLLASGKKAEALRLLDGIPKEFETTSYGEKFRQLRREATSR